MMLLFKKQTCLCYFVAMVGILQQLLIGLTCFPFILLPLVIAGTLICLEDLVIAKMTEGVGFFCLVCKTLCALDEVVLPVLAFLQTWQSLRLIVASKMYSRSWGVVPQFMWSIFSAILSRQQCTSLLGKLEFYHLLSWFACDENLKRTHQKD